jgi:hypothetical protein
VRGEVVGEHFGGPGWFGDLSSWSELGEPGFDVEDGCAVDGVEAFDMEIESVDFDEAAAGYPKPVEPSHVAVAR